MEKGELWDELDRVGKVMDINMPKNASTGKPYGYAFVEFGDGPRRGCQSPNLYTPPGGSRLGFLYGD